MCDNFAQGGAGKQQESPGFACFFVKHTFAWGKPSAKDSHVRNPLLAQHGAVAGVIGVGRIAELADCSERGSFDSRSERIGLGVVPALGNLGSARIAVEAGVGVATEVDERFVHRGHRHCCSLDDSRRVEVDRRIGWDSHTVGCNQSLAGSLDWDHSPAARNPGRGRHFVGLVDADRDIGGPGRSRGACLGGFRSD